jgi:hypothetical protein
MPVYAADRSLPGITMDQLAGAQQAAIDTCGTFSREGRPIRYIRSMYVPGDDRCLCLFDAENADVVKAVNDEAGIPYTRIIEAMDLTP